MLEQVAGDSLVWFPEKGIGFYPVNADVYDASYFNKYQRMASAPMGQQLTKARVDLVRRHYTGEVVDIGIGSGQFVNEIKGRGYDVNPVAVEWLKANKKYKDPYRGNEVECMTFWDSLEHIEDPRAILSRAKEWVFVSMPIYRNLGHLLKSKHFRKDEHFWYFTQSGFVNFMQAQGFSLAETSRVETDIGREDILSFAFKRMDD